MTTPEGKIKAKVNRALKDFVGIWKFMPVQMGLGAPALDYLLCVNGQFVAIETKAPGKRMSPRQEKTAAAIINAGGDVYIVDGDETLEELRFALRALCGEVYSDWV